LSRYSSITDCIIIYNQQYIKSENTLRLTDLPLDEYSEIVPKRNDNLYSFIYSHKKEINKEYNKPWGNIHNIWQWGITDRDLRIKLNELGYNEVYFKNYGQFSELTLFENHGFFLLRITLRGKNI